MNDVIALLLSISEDPTVDFTYRLSALKALTQIEGRNTADEAESRDIAEIPTVVTVSGCSKWCLPEGYRFGVN